MSRNDVYVVPLGSVGRRDLATAGGKGANLGELVKADFPVPSGFVVPTAAYEAVVEAGGLGTVISQGTADDGGASIRAAVLALTVPDELRTAIFEAYTALGGGPVAVRSSATAEDLPDAAFAGQQDTYLNVVGNDAVLDAVRRCWASLWTERAIAYRDRQGMARNAVRMAVVVQRMVDAELAGVMFTANPVTGERAELVVDASPGLGEAVVSGLVTPDHYVLDEHGVVREHTPGRCEVVIRSASGGGVLREQPATAGGAPRLPESVLRELSGLGRKVEAHFGPPQDIEWVYADGRIWLLQARPITALPPQPLRLSRRQREFAMQLMDYVTVRPYPLDVSAWILPGIARMVTGMLDNLGLRVDFSEMLPESGGVVQRFRPVLPRPTPRVLTAPARVLPKVRRFDPAGWSADPRFARFRREVDELGATDLRTLGWTDLVRSARRALAATWLLTALRVDHFPRVAVTLLRLRLLLKVLSLTELFPMLTAGARTRTSDTNRALEDLAARVRADAYLRQAFADLGPHELLDHIGHDPQFDDFKTAFRSFLAEYGHRETSSPLLISDPTWGDAPATVLGLVKLLVEQPRPARVDQPALALRRLLGSRIVTVTRTGPRVERLVAAARAGIAMREDTHFHVTEVLPLLRHAALECGRRLTDSGVLSEADDVWHLRLEELEDIADPATLSSADVKRLRSTVAARRARRNELAGVPMITAAELAASPGPEPDTNALVRGTGASSGRATGPVRVVSGPDRFSALRPGDVLVCPYTNPAWTPLFQRAAAVVVDSGGLASHAAIVAREYGIPAVMGTARGTAVLTDGQLVIVDGVRGSVVPA